MKNILPLVSLILLLNSNITSAQSNFQKTYGGAGHDFGTDVIQTFDGGFLIAGYTNSFGAGNFDGYLIKTDVNGDTLWTKTYGDTAIEEINSVKQTNDSGYIFTGFTTSFGAGGEDVYLVKTDKSGNPLWQRTFGGANNDAGSEVRQTSDGGYIVVGYNNSLGAVDSLVNGVYVIKTDANGDSLWTKVFAGPSLTANDVGNSIYQTNDGGYIITGSGEQKDSTNSDVYLLKIDSSGNVLWDKYIGGSGDDGGSSVQQTTDHGFIITGTTNSFDAGSNDAYLIKTDSVGDISWTKTYGGPSEDEGIYGHQTADGGYFVIGESGSFGIGIKSFYFICTDENGDTLWTEAYGDTTIDIGISGNQTTDGGFILAGYRAIFRTPVVDIHLIKIDANGYASCDQTNTATIVTTPAPSYVSPVILESTGGSVATPVSLISGGCIVSSLCTTVGIDEKSNENAAISIYPNPATDQITVYGLLWETKQSVIIYNMLGEVVSSQLLIINYQLSINVSSLPSGIYFIQIAGEKQSWVGKLVKE